MTHVEEWRAEILDLLRENDIQRDIMHHELHQILEKVTIMQAEWDNLKDKVSKLTTVTASVKALLLDLITKVNAAPSIEAVRAVTAEISANVDSLSEAVPVNTPADPNILP